MRAFAFVIRSYWQGHLVRSLPSLFASFSLWLFNKSLRRPSLFSRTGATSQFFSSQFQPRQGSTCAFIGCQESCWFWSCCIRKSSNFAWCAPSSKAGPCFRQFVSQISCSPRYWRSLLGIGSDLPSSKWRFGCTNYPDCNRDLKRADSSVGVAFLRNWIQSCSTDGSKFFGYQSCSWKALGKLLVVGQSFGPKDPSKPVL